MVGSYWGWYLAAQVTVAAQIILLAWIWRRRVTGRRCGQAAALWRADSDLVREAADLAREQGGVCVLSVEHARGWAWWACRAVPGDDLVVTTGWCRTRAQLRRIAVRNALDAAASQITVSEQPGS